MDFCRFQLLYYLIPATKSCFVTDFWFPCSVLLCNMPQTRHVLCNDTGATHKQLTPPGLSCRPLQRSVVHALGTCLISPVSPKPKEAKCSQAQLSNLIFRPQKTISVADLVGRRCDSTASTFVPDSDKTRRRRPPH